jgi:hypothetical protein
MAASHKLLLGMKSGSTFFYPNPDRTFGMKLHNIPKKNKFKSAPSSGKVMATVFSNDKGVTLVNFLPSRATLNSDHYSEIL